MLDETGLAAERLACEIVDEICPSYRSEVGIPLRYWQMRF